MKIKTCLMSLLMLPLFANANPNTYINLTNVVKEFVEREKIVEQINFSNPNEAIKVIYDKAFLLGKEVSEKLKDKKLSTPEYHKIYHDLIVKYFEYTIDKSMNMYRSNNDLYAKMLNLIQSKVNEAK